MQFAHPTCRVMPAFLAALTAGATVSAQTNVPTRDQVPDRYKWDLSTIYPDVKAWETDFARAKGMIAQLQQRKNAPLDSPEAFLETLTLGDETRWLVGKLLVYAHQLFHQDMRDNTALGMKDRSASLSVSLDEASSWVQPKLLTVPAETLRAWCKESDKLRVYAHFVENIIREKAHTLSPREEELLAMAGNLASSPSDTYGILKNAELIWPTIQDEDGKDVQLSSARFTKYIRSTDRRVRRDAFMGSMEAYKRFENTMTTTLNGSIQRDLFYARARGFKTCLEASLFPDNLPLSVYTNLGKTINANLHVQHRWADLRKRVLGLDELHVYDLYQPLVESSAREYEYDDAVAMIIAALQPLGLEYCEPMTKGFASRWIDVYETQGKRSGGYSWGSYDTPPFILLNYNKTFREVSTIAHEMGHSMHSYFTHKHQPKVYGDYSYFVAEVAAIFNEVLLQDHMLKNADTRAKKLEILNNAIDNLRGTVIRQVMFSEFEAEVHAMAERGDPLTAERLNKLYVDIFHKYWGPQLVRDEEHGPYWAVIPHYYRNFYVYRYATSYCAAVALAKDVLANKPGALEAYLAFLKAGSSDYPLEILRKAGVDMTTPAPIEATMRHFEDMITEVEKLLKAENAAKAG